MENINFKASMMQPNELEVKYWVDLNADANGGVIKFYDTNTKTWMPIKAGTDAPDNSAILTDISNLKNNKVDKVSGKVLSTNDFTSTEKTKLGTLVNYNDSTLRGLITALTTRVTALETA